jgi:hypothetical protein
VDRVRRNGASRFPCQGRAVTQPKRVFGETIAEWFHYRDASRAFQIQNHTLACETTLSDLLTAKAKCEMANVQLAASLRYDG